MQQVKHFTQSDLKSIILEFDKNNHDKTFTLQMLLIKLKMDSKFFAILVNGKAVKDLSINITPDDEILILPKIAGG